MPAARGLGPVSRRWLDLLELSSHFKAGASSDDYIINRPHLRNAIASEVELIRRSTRAYGLCESLSHWLLRVNVTVCYLLWITVTTVSAGRGCTRCKDDREREGEKRRRKVRPSCQRTRARCRRSLLRFAAFAHFRHHPLVRLSSYYLWRLLFISLFEGRSALSSCSTPHTPHAACLSEYHVHSF